MAGLLRRVKTRLSITAHRKVRGLLDGEYVSVFHGRSMDFDDLRPYVPGDELKDIDWKATARHGHPLTKRYIAARKHTLALLVDTGRNMAALAASGEVKRDIGIEVAGALAYIASRHGDQVCLIAGDATHTEFRTPGSTEAHLERLLQLVHSSTSLASGPSDLTKQLAFTASRLTRRMILLIVADDRELGDRERDLLARLSVQHEILWITIGDADLMREEWSSRSMHDVGTEYSLPAFVRGDRALREEFASSVALSAARSEDFLEALSISSERVVSTADVLPGLFRLLERHKRARR